ncbi:MAG: hypothetical protein Q8R04_06795, partial [Nanoarchaeota archaeon]|nr:hypothetical protein [Nanoarchaeota archaeon]
MLKANDLRYEIAKERVSYCWKIYTAHKVVGGEVPIPPRTGNVPLEQLAANLFPKARPEAIDIEDEIRRDLDNFNLVLNGNYSPETTSKKLGVRQPLIETDEGKISCADLAFNGILTQSAYACLNLKKRNDLANHYSLLALAQVFGIDCRVVYNNFDEKRGLLFGEYPALATDKREKGGVDETAIQRMAREADNCVLLSEIGEHVSNKYGITKILAYQKIYDFGKNPAAFVAEGDPYNGYSFNVFDLFGVYKVMDLRSLNALINITIRDKRLLETHFGTAKAAEKLGINGRTVRELIERGSLSARNMSILPAKGTKQMPYLVCEYDMEQYEQKKEKLSLPKFKETLEMAGVSNCKDSVYDYLKGKGLVNGNLQGSKGTIAPDKVDDIIKMMRADGRFSLDYLSYCKSMALEPNSDATLAEFQRDYAVFQENKEIASFISEKFDFTYKGKNLRDIDSRKTSLDKVIGGILQRNQASIVELRKKFSSEELGEFGLSLNEGKIYVPAAFGYFPIQRVDSSRYTENYGLRK